MVGSVVYIPCMLSRKSRGRPLNAPAAFIHPCQPIVAEQTLSSRLAEHRLFGAATF